jgi:hypothetical protein
MREGLSPVTCGTVLGAVPHALPAVAGNPLEGCERKEVQPVERRVATGGVRGSAAPHGGGWRGTPYAAGTVALSGGRSSHHQEVTHAPAVESRLPLAGCRRKSGLRNNDADLIVSTTRVKARSRRNLRRPLPAIFAGKAGAERHVRAELIRNKPRQIGAHSWTPAPQRICGTQWGSPTRTVPVAACYWGSGRAMGFSRDTTTMMHTGRRGGCTVSRQASCVVLPLNGAAFLPTPGTGRGCFPVASVPSKGNTVAEATEATEIRQLQPATIGVEGRRRGPARPRQNHIVAKFAGAADGQTLAREGAWTRDHRASKISPSSPVPPCYRREPYKAGCALGSHPFRLGRAGWGRGGLD